MPIHFGSPLCCTGISASVPGDSCISSVIKGTLVPIPSCLRCHAEQYNEFEMVHDNSCDMNLGLRAYSSSQEVYWSRTESLWYPHDLDAGLVICVETSVEPGLKRQNDLTVLEDCKL